MDTKVDLAAARAALAAQALAGFERESAARSAQAKVGPIKPPPPTGRA